MSDRKEKRRLTRKEFLDGLGRGAVMLTLGGLTGALAMRWRRKGFVWQIDPYKCNQCGRCATHCVLNPSAVKCKHDFSMCGYCKLCLGYFRTNPAALDEAAENQMCPIGAITRRFIEDPYFEYTIDEARCNGCAKCVKGCAAFGNGSIYMQVSHDLCLNCNECAIAVACPSDAFVRVPADNPYFVKHKGPEQIAFARKR
ncbi:MAG TPA: ferredoxin [Candidatus Brocadiia bacterium]|nr:ferredoxin [Candidatus Brocadiia bacterium]